MPEQRAIIALESPGVPSSKADASVTVFSPARRATRAAIVLLVAIAFAAALIPIPIIHLVGIPLAIVAGIALAIIQLRTVARLAAVRIPCPRCGASQLIGGGMGFRSIDGPIEVNCDSCRRPLVLSINVTMPVTGE